MDYIIENIGQSLIVLGVIFLIIEVLVLGFSTFFLAFTGLALLVTGALVMLDVIPDTLTSILVTLLVTNTVSALLLYKPLKKLQREKKPETATNDIMGLQFVTEFDVKPNTPNDGFKYSGLTWQVKSDSDIPKGTKVTITKMEVGAITVKPV